MLEAFPSVFGMSAALWGLGLGPLGFQDAHCGASGSICFRISGLEGSVFTSSGLGATSRNSVCQHGSSLGEDFRLGFSVAVVSSCPRLAKTLLCT